MLQLYPELQGSQEFHPWKRSLFSVSLALENSASTPLFTAALHTHPLSRSLTCEDRHSILQNFAPHHLYPRQFPLVGQSQQQTQPSLELVEQTKSAAQGWLGSSRRGSGLARNAWQQARPDMYRLIPSLYPLFFPSVSPHFIYLPPFYHLISTPLLPPSLPLSHC